MATHRPTFSESWSRIADLKPSLRATAQVHRQWFRGRAWRVVRDAASNEHFRISQQGADFAVTFLDLFKFIDDAGLHELLLFIFNMEQGAYCIEQAGIATGYGRSQVDAGIMCQLVDEAARQCLDNFPGWCAAVQLLHGFMNGFFPVCLCMLAVGAQGRYRLQGLCPCTKVCDLHFNDFFGLLCSLLA